MKKLSKSFLAGLTVFLSFASRAKAQVEDIIGTIETPPGVGSYNDDAGGIGIIVFASRVIQIATVFAGVWVMINFVLAGWIYITSSGDTAAHQKVSSKITMSIIGLVIIVSAYTIAGLLGLIIFGNAGYILNPTFEGAT